MKPLYLFPALTAVLGFAIAWVAKPDSPAIGTTQVAENASPTEVKNTRSGPQSRASREDSKRPVEVSASDFPLADAAEKGPKSKDEARMLRLTEALGLSLEQQGEIISLIESAQKMMDGKAPVIEDLNTRGKLVEEGLAKLLTPEQLAKFQELRVRERDNRNELRSHQMLARAMEDIDLSPTQREDLLLRLRQKTKADLQQIPAAATLLFDKSLLPTNGKELSVDGILLLAKINEDDQNRSPDPNVTFKRVADSHRREIEETLKCYDGILTPGQMGQYQAILNESKKILDNVERHDQAARLNPPPEASQIPKGPGAPEVEDHTGDFEQPLPELNKE
jgi:hypothetical protein